MSRSYHKLAAPLELSSPDLYIIGAVCMYVCNEKAYFLYSRDFDDLYIIGAVCMSVTKVIISVFKGFGRFSCF